MTIPYDKNWLYSRSQLPTLRQEEDESRTNLLLQMANNIVDMSARISQLESRLILNANVTKLLEERIEQLEANRGRYYAINHEQLPKMLEQLVERVDQLESWLYTHEYDYFKWEEENKSGNSSFEDHELTHPDPSYVEDEPFDREVPGFDDGINSSLEREDVP